MCIVKDIQHAHMLGTLSPMVVSTATASPTATMLHTEQIQHISSHIPLYPAHTLCVNQGLNRCIVPHRS